jgi:hypothetical protein
MRLAWYDFSHHLRLYRRNFRLRKSDFDWDQSSGPVMYRLLKRLPPQTLRRTIG